VSDGITPSAACVATSAIQLWSLHAQRHQLRWWGVFICFTWLHAPLSTEYLLSAAHDRHSWHVWELLGEAVMVLPYQRLNFQKLHGIIQ
jgi:hypothetical protein